MKWLDDLSALPPGTLGRRIGYALLLAAGVTMTAMGSMFWTNWGPLPFRAIPDVRPILTVGSGLFLGLYASGGGAERRKLALWGVVGYIAGFHLEEATVHWIAPYEGSITNTRVGILGMAGTILALVAVFLIHLEVEHAKLGRELAARGAGEREARGMAEALRGLGTARIVGIGAAIAGMAVLVRVGEALFGNSAPGGVYTLFLGAAVLLALAFVLVRFVPRRA